METLKQKIAKLAQEQKSLKQQRKTVTFKGERIIAADEAAWKVVINKGLLRSMYVAYGTLLGHEYSVIESNPKEPFTENEIKTLVEKWKDCM